MTSHLRNVQTDVSSRDYCNNLLILDLRPDQPAMCEIRCRNIDII